MGSEILDFSLFIPHIGEPGVLPKLNVCFYIEDTELKCSSFKEGLLWAYRTYVLRQQAVPRQV